MTARSDWVAHLTRYKLKELRRRQSICQQQIKAYIAYFEKANLPVNSEILARMQTMYDSLTEAIMIKHGYLRR